LNLPPIVIGVGYPRNLGTESKEDAFSLLGMKILKHDYSGGVVVYTPEEKEVIKIEVVDSSSIRKLTKEEVENKELASAKSSENWAKKQAEDLRKEVEELKCQIKVLSKKTRNKILEQKAFNSEVSCLKQGWKALA
jgi:hypothetical protein